VIEQGRFFVPGPTEVRPEILDAMRRPMIFHRTREMEELMERVTRRLGPVFGTARTVHVISGSGTAAMELAIRSGTRRRVLAVVHGDFGERFARMAEACGREVVRLTCDTGHVVPLDRIRDALRGGTFDAVTVTHCETAVGVLADVAAIAAMARESADCLVLADAVSSAGGVPFAMDAWGVDCVVSASQKAIAAPPGLGFAATSARLLERAKGLEDRGTYLDLLRYEEFAARRQSPTTPAIPLLFALDAQMAHIEQEGMESRWRRHQAMAAASVAAVERYQGEGHPVSVVAREGHRSPTVTAIRSPAAAAVLEGMRARGYMLGGGQAPLASDSFRIGHMGDHTVPGVQGVLDALEQVLRGL
jgi:aspartate aminotransferase-like enzyme